MKTLQSDTQDTQDDKVKSVVTFFQASDFAHLTILLFS